MNALAALEAAGLQLRVESGRLLVRPPTMLNDELRALIRANRESLVQAVTLRSSRDPGDVRAGYGRSLQTGSQVVCIACAHAERRLGQQPDGHCRRFSEETWLRVPFSCAAYLGGE
jgi:hypothetical protein